MLAPVFADSNGDGFLDENELEALFTKEVIGLKLWLCRSSINEGAFAVTLVFSQA